MMGTDSLLYVVAGVVCVLSSLILCVWHYWNRRKEQKKLEKGKFGFPVADWKVYNEENTKNMNHLKKTIEAEDSWVPPDHEVVGPLKEADSELEDEESPEDSKHEEEIPSTDGPKNESPEGGECGDEEEGEESSPVPPCEDALSGKLKTLKLRQAAKKVEEDMTDEQKEEEAEVRRRQLAKIFELMNSEQNKFGVSSVDDVQEQMRLYSL